MGFFTRWKINRLIKDIKNNDIGKNNLKKINYYLSPGSVTDSDTIYDVRYKLIPTLEEFYNKHKNKSPNPFERLKEMIKNAKMEFGLKMIKKKNSSFLKTKKLQEITFDIENRDKIANILKGDDIFKKYKLEQEIFKNADQIVNSIDILKNEIKESEGKIGDFNLNANILRKTAALLYFFGLDNLKFKGAGTFNVVWEDTKNKKAYKVCFQCDYESGISVDQEKNAKIHNLIEQIKKDSNKDWTKYLSDAKPLDGIRIFESDLATLDGFDWAAINVKRKEERKKGGQNRPKKTLDSALHKMKNITICVVELHKKGISINDLKYENLLKMHKSEYDVSDEELKKYGFEKREGKYGKQHWYKRKKNKYGKEYWHRIHKNYWQVADMGGYTNIENESKKLEKPISTPGYTDEYDPKTGRIIYSTHKTNISMRDMYALGIIFLGFLCRSPVSDWTAEDFTNGYPSFLVEILEDFKKNNDQDFYDKHLKEIYIDDDHKDYIMKIMELIRQMLSKKIQYSDVLNKLKSIEENMREYC